MASTGLFQMFASGFVTSTGLPLSGGLVYHYYPGTTTVKPIWTNPERTTQAAQPVVLGTDGIAEIYGSGSYDLTVKTSTGTAVRDFENVYAGGGEPMLQALKTATSDGQATFDLGFAYDEGSAGYYSLKVYLNGLKLVPTVDYTEDGTAGTITLVAGQAALVRAGWTLEFSVDGQALQQAYVAATADGQATFSTGFAYTAGTNPYYPLKVFYNGIKLSVPGGDYTENGSLGQITLATGQSTVVKVGHIFEFIVDG